MKIFLPAACAVALLLSGCQAFNSNDMHPAPATAAHTTTQQPRTSLQMQQLWLEGGLSDSTALPVATIRADSDRVTLSWNGDVVELLSALARARGQKFSYTGVRLPLPVDIEVQDVTYANVLRMIEIQTAWRATFVTYPGQIVLQFMPSLPAEPGRNHKGGRR